ncbi:hypothetical protein [Brevibacillus borstelensis]|uniref:hypothetical protein n=1 Tax=Brevibacillus borstelensis TaxID=45462 RepID=UPI0030C32949
MTQKAKEASAKDPLFTKALILTSKRFNPLEKDFLQAVLDEGKSYSVEQVNEILKKALTKEVK